MNDLETYLNTVIEAVSEEDAESDDKDEQEQENNMLTTLDTQPEQELEEGVLVDEEQEHIVFTELNDVDINSEFRPLPAPDNYDEEPKKRDQLPVNGAGVIDNLVVISESSEFSVRLELDNKNILDETFSNLDPISDTLTHVSAYEHQNLGEYIVTVDNYPFKNWVDFKITPEPGSPITLKLVRVEIIVEEFHD